MHPKRGNNKKKKEIANYIIEKGIHLVTGAPLFVLKHCTLLHKRSFFDGYVLHAQSEQRLLHLFYPTLSFSRLQHSRSRRPKEQKKKDARCTLTQTYVFAIFTTCRVSANIYHVEPRHRTPSDLHKSVSCGDVE